MKILKSISDVTPELISKIIAPCVPFDTSQEHVVLSNGYDNFAVDFGAHIVRFPKDEEGLEGLRFEQKICNRILGLPLQTPRPIVIEGPTPFSWHRKIPGVWLTSDLYGALDDARKNDVCERLVDLFCFMHTIPHHEASAMGAQISSPHPEPEDLQRLLVSKVPPSLAGHFQETLEAYEQMIQTPSPMVFGYFDAHGQNMAFDPSKGLLLGVYDFQDSGFGAVEREFSPLATISPDLLQRAARLYQKRTDLTVDFSRILLQGVLNDYLDLSETDETGYDPAYFIKNIHRWQNTVLTP